MGRLIRVIVLAAIGLSWSWPASALDLTPVLVAAPLTPQFQLGSLASTASVQTDMLAGIAVLFPATTLDVSPGVADYLFVMSRTLPPRPPPKKLPPWPEPPSSQYNGSLLLPTLLFTLGTLALIVILTKAQE